MNKRLVLMPCVCQFWQNKLYTLNEISIYSESEYIVIIKIKCLFCLITRKQSLTWKRYNRLFRGHKDLLDEKTIKRNKRRGRR